MNIWADLKVTRANCVVEVADDGSDRDRIDLASIKLYYPGSRRWLQWIILVCRVQVQRQEECTKVVGVISLNDEIVSALNNDLGAVGTLADHKVDSLEVSTRASRRLNCKLGDRDLKLGGRRQNLILVRAWSGLSKSDLCNGTACNFNDEIN